jgi:hypothetical protein
MKYLLEDETVLFHESGDRYKYLPESEIFTSR